LLLWAQNVRAELPDNNNKLANNFERFFAGGNQFVAFIVFNQQQVNFSQFYNRTD